MEVQQDFKELLKLFNAHNVEYIIIGGYALAFHGAPRYTGDIDLLIKPDKENARKVLNALKDFGFAALDLSTNDFSSPEKVVQLGVPPVRIDIVTSITGVTWEQVASNRVNGTYGDIQVYYIGKQEFIANKRAISRHKDLADIEALGEKID
ncbi:hypothetical protein BMS3Bbin05_00378 [bacterium BMS3Bbin05]|nr:hypothetical protein BMS3Bbin05_00378 [bacterium BMS3Bbin05]HDL20532.1 hypothetical protein [Nitrospirota bacterium]HDO21845.1 hypothetical protein [Nitrospirota bacterium]